MRKGKYEIKETETEGRKATFWRHFTNISEHTAGLTVSVMKRGLSVRPITSDWCSWVADWWQAAKRRRRRSSACQLKEQFMCVCLCVRVYECVCVCCTDKRNWQLTAGGKGCVCARAFVCVSCLTQLDILTMLMRDQQRTIGEFHADFVLSRWHTMQGLALTHTRTHTPLHINTCVCFQSLTKKKNTHKYKHSLT